MTVLWLVLIQEKSRKCVISSQHAKFSLSFNWHGILVLWLYKEDLKILSVIQIRIWLLDFLDETIFFNICEPWIGWMSNTWPVLTPWLTAVSDRSLQHDVRCLQLSEPIWCEKSAVIEPCIVWEVCSYRSLHNVRSLQMPAWWWCVMTWEDLSLVPRLQLTLAITITPLSRRAPWLGELWRNKKKQSDTTWSRVCMKSSCRKYYVFILLHSCSIHDLLRTHDWSVDQVWSLLPAPRLQQ